jgi:hypothetical protein
MSIAVRKRRTDEVYFGLVYGTIAILAIFAAHVLPLADLLPSCVFKAMTSIPCPTCGATRSLMHLAHGDIVAAFRMNPLFALTVIAAFLALLFDAASLLGNLPRISLVLTPSDATRIRIALVLIFLMNWMYLIGKL